MSRATMVDLPPEEENADNIEENEVDEIQQADAEQPQEEEQPTTQPAATTSRDRAKAQLAIYNLNK